MLRTLAEMDRALYFVRILAGYGCAGVDQDPEDPALCGTCGPCEAGAFLKALAVPRPPVRRGPGRPRHRRNRGPLDLRCPTCNAPNGVACDVRRPIAGPFHSSRMKRAAGTW